MFTRTLVSLFLITLLVAIPVTCAQETAQEDSSRQQFHKSKIDLPNFHQVHPFLFRGGEPTVNGLKQLAGAGITTIIDLRGNPRQIKEEKNKAKQLGMHYINLPMSSNAPTEQQVTTFLKTVESAAQDPKKGAVFVHCAHGSDRTGCMVGIWRVTHDGLTFDEAYKEMRKYYFTPKFTLLSGCVRDHATTRPKLQQNTVTRKTNKT